MLILGLSSFTHDSAAGLLEDGAVRAAIEESKLTRLYTRGLPEKAMGYCLSKGGIAWHDLDIVAVASRPFRGWLRRAIPVHSSPFSSANVYYEANQLGTLARQLSDLRQLRHENGTCKFKLMCLDHHLCHAAATFFQSPFERALVVTMDEGTDGNSGMVAVGEGNRLREVETLAFPHSLAWVYTQITALLGFVPRKEEHKTQWLGMSGEPLFKDVLLDLMRGGSGSPLPRLNRKLVERDATGRLKLSQSFFARTGIPERGSELGDDVRQALAGSLQQACFEIVRDVIRHYQKKLGTDKVCLGGGLFHNIVLVSALEKEFGLNQIFVPAAPGNAGCAIGAGLYAWHHVMQKPRQESPFHVYWGPVYNRHEIEDMLTNSKARYSCHNTDERRLDAALQLLQNDKIIAWFQGAAEFGSRALGNRSLLASPWGQYVKENLNDYIKHREWFRPFAIAIPEEDCDRYFECSKLCRFMSSLATLRPEANVLPEGFVLPGNQVRLHVVEKQANPAFWQLLKRFGTIAPAPMLINTSFNMSGEPLIAKPQDALRSYFCSGIDALVIDRIVLSKYPVPNVSSPTLTTTLRNH